MTLKELSQLYYLNREIEIDQQRLEELRAKAFGASAMVLSHAPGGGKAESQLEKDVAEIVDLEAILSAKITQCMHERNRLERYIADIPDSLMRQIFTLRFINGLSWWQVAYSIGGNNTDVTVRQACHRYIKRNSQNK